jgi:class 3 adenylate cyclase
MASRNLTVFIADLKGFTPRTASSSRHEINKLLSNFRRLITPVIIRCGGRVVKEMGDAFMVTFESPTNALAAGALLQRLLGDRNSGSSPHEQIEVRIAIHCGDVEESANDIIGDAVNVASRVESVAEVGEVYFTEAVFLTMNRSEVPSAEVGERVLKGIEKPIKLYRVLQDPGNDRYLRLLAGQPLINPKKISSLRTGLLLSLGGLLLVTAIVLMLGMFFFHNLPLRNARKLVNAGRHAEAVDSLTRAFDKEIPPTEALKLIESAANVALEKRIAANDFAGARELAGKWNQRWSNLRELPVKVALSEAAHLLKNDKAQAAAFTLRTVAADHDHWRVHLELARLHLRQDVLLTKKDQRPHWGRFDVRVEELGQAIRLLPPGTPLPEALRQELWTCFSNHPSGNNYHVSIARYNLIICKIAAQHLLPEYRWQMLAACSGAEDNLRENSYSALSISGNVMGIDQLAYHCRRSGYLHISSKVRKKSTDFLSAAERTPDEKKRAAKLLQQEITRLSASKRSSAKKLGQDLKELQKTLGDN